MGRYDPTPRVSSPRGAHLLAALVVTGAGFLGIGMTATAFKAGHPGWSAVLLMVTIAAMTLAFRTPELVRNWGVVRLLNNRAPALGVALLAAFALAIATPFLDSLFLLVFGG